MSEAIDFAAAQQVVQQSVHTQEDEVGQLATATAHAPDDISMAYVSKEVSQAMSYSVTADEMKSNAARIQSTTVTHAPVGAQDAHILQARLRSKHAAEDDATEDDIFDEASKIRHVQSLKGETSGASTVTHDEPDLDKFEFPVAAAAAARPPTILKPRKPILQALTLPNEQSPQPSPDGSEDSRTQDSPARTPPPYVAHAMMNKRPPKALTRLKTRLQDPPPMTPAVSALVARGRLFSNSPEDHDFQPLMTGRGLPTSRKVSAVGNLSRVASFAAATPGKLRSMASALFTPRGGTASTAAGFQPPEEEVDSYLEPG